MLRILRWMALGLLLVAFAAPAVQAQIGGIDTVTPASGPDRDPNGSPSPAAMTAGLSAGSSVDLDRTDVGGAPDLGQRFVTIEPSTSTMHSVVKTLLPWFLL